MTVQRISGLVSGIDTDSVIKQLMESQSAPLVKMQQGKQKLQWQQEDYRSINTTLRTFRDTVFNLKLQSSYLAKTASSSDTNMVTASAGSNALEGTHSLTVTQLAKGASLTSSSKLGSTADLTTLAAQLPISGNQTVTINDVEFMVKSDSDSIYDLVRAINGNSAAGVSLNITTKATDSIAQVQKLKLVDSALTEGLVITAGDIKVGLWDSTKGTYKTEAAAKTALGVDYIYDLNNASYDTADEIITSVAGLTAPSGATWARTGAGELTITSSSAGSSNAVTATVSGGKQWTVRASYDETQDRFFLTTNTTGAGQSLKVKDGTLSQLLKLTSGSDIIKEGQNAVVHIDDLNNLEYESNKFTLNGVTYNLLNADQDKSVSINVQNDTDAIVKNIIDFIKSYNDIIETLNDKISETRYSDYQPLTDDEKGKLTETQMDAWNKKARSGDLRNDTILNSVVNKMRSSLSTVVPGLSGGNGYNNIAKIGITTGSYEENGKLYVDETKLREAIQKDPQGVMELFTRSSDSYNNKGIAQRLYDDVNNAMTSIAAKAGSDSSYSIYDTSTMGKRLSEIADNIDSMEDRLTEIEDRYYKQFTAMEEAISQLNNQSSWLLQYLSGSSS